VATVAQDTFITVASYRDSELAKQDWEAMEDLAKTGEIRLADAALVTHDEEGKATILERQEHHGWGKGAVLGAVVGILFPPSLIGGAVAGGLAGGLVARLNRALNRGDVKDLGEVVDDGKVALVAVTDQGSVDSLKKALGKADKTTTRQAKVDAVDLQRELTAAS
jgi:uncharacterized membrane protein